MTLSDLLEKTKGFTPGEWKSHDWRVVDQNGEGGLCTMVICDTANNQRTRTPENKANAALIAAAPYLLTLAQEQAAQLDKAANEIHMLTRQLEEATDRLRWASQDLTSPTERQEKA